MMIAEDHLHIIEKVASKNSLVHCTLFQPQKNYKLKNLCQGDNFLGSFLTLYLNIGFNSAILHPFGKLIILLINKGGFFCTSYFLPF